VPPGLLAFCGVTTKRRPLSAPLLTASVSFGQARLLLPSHARLGFWLIGHCPTFAAWYSTLRFALRGLASRGDGMPSSAYYHRQADLCVRMALSASGYEERIRLLDRANEYRDRASQAEALDAALAPATGNCKKPKGGRISRRLLAAPEPSPC
jgi:hypothetical protein